MAMKRKNLPTEPGAVLFEKNGFAMAVLSRGGAWVLFDRIGVVRFLDHDDFRGLRDWRISTIADFRRNPEIAGTAWVEWQ